MARDSGNFSSFSFQWFFFGRGWSHAQTCYEPRWDSCTAGKGGSWRDATCCHAFLCLSIGRFISGAAFMNFRKTPVQTVFCSCLQSLCIFVLPLHLITSFCGHFPSLFDCFIYYSVSHCGYCESLCSCFASFWTLNKNASLLFLFPFFFSQMWKAWADVSHFSHGLWMLRISEMEMTFDALYSGEMNLGKT